MYIELTPEQRHLQGELRQYFSNLISAEERAEMEVDRHGKAYRAIIKRMGSDGKLGVGWPKEYGGHGFGPVEQSIFVNEAARADVPLPAVTAGELLAVPVAGAYQLAMGSNYNGACRPAVLWLHERRAQLIQRRETVAELVARDLPLVNGC